MSETVKKPNTDRPLLDNHASAPGSGGTTTAQDDDASGGTTGAEAPATSGEGTA